MTKKEKAEARQNSLEMLRRLCPPGTKVYCVLRHVSRSGMMRRIDLYTFSKGDDGQCEKTFLTGYASHVLGYSWNDDGLRVDGCGMDMGHHVVMNLSYAIHGRDNVNVPKDKDGQPFKPSKDAYRAGYSLVHEWM